MLWGVLLFMFLLNATEEIVHRIQTWWRAKNPSNHGLFWPFLVFPEIFSFQIKFTFFDDIISWWWLNNVLTEWHRHVMASSIIKISAKTEISILRKIGNNNWMISKRDDVLFLIISSLDDVIRWCHHHLIPFFATFYDFLRFRPFCAFFKSGII